MELQGHRGARGVFPENSLPGFRHALLAGVDALELDVAMTADREIVIAHDPVLNIDLTRRDGEWLNEALSIKSLTVQELDAFDVGRLRPGTAYGEKFPDQAPIDGLRIPLLADLLAMPDLFEYNHVLLDIEIKTFPGDVNLTFPPEVIAEALIKLVDRHGWRSRVRIRSFDWRGLMYLRHAAPDLPLAFLTVAQPWLDTLQAGRERPSPWLGGLNIDDYAGSAAAAIRSLGGEVWAPHHQDVCQSVIHDAQARGLKVIPWTVNDASEMRTLMEWGVDGFTTDYPELGRRVIDERSEM